MNTILFSIKKCIPRALFQALQPAYHFMLSFCAAFFYGFPSKGITVIGVTGTTGKTTTIYLAAKMLQNAGLRVGYTSTALFSDGKKEWINDKKMTMLGRFFTQKMLRRMRQNKCDVAIVETTSQGIAQYRHQFIYYDTLVFTGLYPEHIEAHGSFEKYKQAKLELFRHFERQRRKGTHKKTLIINGDDEHAADFANYAVDEKIIFTKDEKKGGQELGKAVCYKVIETNASGVEFVFDGNKIQLQLLGDFTATNATAAGCIGKTLHLTSEQIKNGLESIAGVPGRMEKIDEGQNFMVIVDYAFEPHALKMLYDTISQLKPQNIFHVFGSTGGGRDVWRRKEIGALASERAHAIFVTNEDPYDDDPQAIIDEVFQGLLTPHTPLHSPQQRKMVEGENCWRILDRREAIRKALGMAQRGDCVLITGKGCERTMCVKDGKAIPWDEREIVREELQKTMKKE